MSNDLLMDFNDFVGVVKWAIAWFAIILIIWKLIDIVI